MNFKSVFKDEMELFILMKRNESLKYKKEESILTLIDCIIIKCNIIDKCISKEQFSTVMVCFSNRTLSQQATIYKLFVIFIKFLTLQEIKNCEYVELTYHYHSGFVPFLYTKEDFIKIVNAVDDAVEAEKNHRYFRLYYSYSIIIRLLYSSGLRRSEATNLTYSDVNFELKTISILNSKRNVSRLIPLSDSMFAMLSTYITYFNIKKGMLFVNTTGNKINGNHLFDFYKRIIQSLRFTNNVRLHDLRHQFANEAYSKITNNGIDEKVALVYLHRYLGHNTIYETEHYLHSTTLSKESLLKKNSEFSKKIFSEVKINEK